MSPCDFIEVAGAQVIICSKTSPRTRRPKPKPCHFCGAPTLLLCDGPGTKSVDSTCDKPICRDCSIHLTRNDLDVCLDCLKKNPGGCEVGLRVIAVVPCAGPLVGELSTCVCHHVIYAAWATMRPGLLKMQREERREAFRAWVVANPEASLAVWREVAK